MIIRSAGSERLWDMKVKSPSIESISGQENAYLRL